MLSDPPLPVRRPQVRVWWPPTSAQGAAEFSGMFWPAEVAGKPEKGEVDLKYDNNAIRKAELVHLQPPEGDVPVKFGKEVESLAAGEFCEVLNNSKQDPGSWVVKIKKLLPDLTAVGIDAAVDVYLKFANRRPKGTYEGLSSRSVDGD